jgi:hypothetical protein
MKLRLNHRIILSLLVLLIGWNHRAAGENLLSVPADQEIMARSWATTLAPCTPGKTYLFQADLFRDHWGSGIYAYAWAWGQRRRLDSHLQSGRYQPIQALFTCPEKSETQSLFIFQNPHPDFVFRMRNPVLEEVPAVNRNPAALPGFFKDRFGIGFYGVHTVADLEAIHKLAANAVLLSGSAKNLEEMIAACNRLGLAYVLSTPHDPEGIASFADRIKDLVRRDRLAFYVNDEPEIRSVPVVGVVQTRQLLKKRFGDIATCMATVRPIGAYIYRDGADYFMSDQYPVPSMPMTWLGDSMDEIAAVVGRQRLASVIQAFGGESWAGNWPRLPTWQEMDALAMLSVLHGSRAIFFFSWSYIEKTEESRADIGRVIGRLNHIYPWLREEASLPKPEVTMLSTYRYDARGKAAVQCGRRNRNGKQLLLCVNTTSTHVETLVQPGDATNNNTTDAWQALFTGTTIHEETGQLHLFFDPYETMALTRKP